MNTYHFAPEETGFQMIETYADGRTRFHGGFSTETVASDWVTNHLSLMDAVGFARWMRERAPYAGRFRARNLCDLPGNVLGGQDKIHRPAYYRAFWYVWQVSGLKLLFQGD